MRRREFISLLGGAAVSWPVAVRAQPGRMSRIAVFAGATNPIVGAGYQAFLEELRRFGFNEGQSLTVDLHETDQDLPTLSKQAADAVTANVNALAAFGSEPVLRACANASRSIPIVFVANNYDPIARGYVHSLAKPGGNVTGVFLRQIELAEKQVELLKEAFPERTKLAVWWDSVSADQFVAADHRAKLLGLEVHSHELRDPPYRFDEAVQSAIDSRSNMLLVLSSPFFGAYRKQIADLLTRHRLPAMFIFKGYVEAGGLMAYGADAVAMYRQAGTFMGKVLTGAKPADLPVEQPTKYEMIVNLKTAKAMGLELPVSILLRADEVIE
jgi:putative tryptophan/tyrosine transport system substrate-binding protein